MLHATGTCHMLRSSCMLGGEGERARGRGDDASGDGEGVQLVQAVKAAAALRGCRRVRLCVANDNDAFGLYTDQGFKPQCYRVGHMILVCDVA